MKTDHLNLNPSIWIGDFEISEPITASTDLLIGLVSIIGFFILSRINNTEQKPMYNLFKNYFLFFFFAMVIAGLFGHALKPHIHPNLKLIGWVISILAHLFLALASLMSIKEVVKKQWYRLLQICLYVQATLFTFFIIFFVNFQLTQIALVVMLIGFALPVNIYGYIKLKSTGNLWIVFGILSALLPALVFNMKLSLSRWFNHHDISHVLIVFVTTLIFIGSYKLVKVKAN